MEKEAAGIDEPDAVTDAGAVVAHCYQVLAGPTADGNPLLFFFRQAAFRISAIPRVSCEAGIFKLVFCPLGKELTSPTYMQCKSCHFLSPRCVISVDFCPSCREGRPYWHNRAIEAANAGLSFSCWHHCRGCTQLIWALAWLFHSDT